MAPLQQLRPSLRLRDVGLILAEQVVVTRGSARHWCRNFGADFASGCADGGLAPGDTWRLGELFIGSRGVLHYLWHAVDQNGVVLDSRCRSGGAALVDSST